MVGAETCENMEAGGYLDLEGKYSLGEEGPWGSWAFSDGRASSLLLGVLEAGAPWHLLLALEKRKSPFPASPSI